ncbi:signal peptidase II [Lachnospiraceae bacterium]|jgi:signal peptidase II|nr:signal peptidase II [uncultured Schaedlerella sp.]EOS41185.1 signal peptidase II [Lachnospiraceae bacterium M18-1]MCI9152428.1 signal peptidase II [Ruminococcus sp.]NBI59808.1 signal peptidase II [Lachnospiraceae bacterium]
MDGQFGKVRDYLTAVLCCAAAVLLDQITKHLAVVHLKQQREIVLIPGVFELRYLENRGAAFGLFQNRQIFFVCAAVVIFFLIGFFYGKIPGGRRNLPMRICAVLICAGAVGNLIDRIRYQYVVDFFYFSLIDFPIFNVADCYAVIACILFAYLILFFYKEEELEWFSFFRSK